MGDSAVVLRQQVLDWLTENVPTPRVEHILRVEQMAAELAEQHGLDAARAAQAGLMHDLAKCFPPSALLTTAIQAGLELDPIFESNPHLLHADVGAVVARQQFGVTDPQVLAAIANHTLGRSGMDGLGCVVYLSDSLEPGRGDSPELQDLRQLSQQDLTQAVWRTSEYTLQQLIAAQRLIHPRALATHNWFLQQTRFAPQPRIRPKAAVSSLFCRLKEKHHEVRFHRSFTDCCISLLRRKTT